MRLHQFLAQLAVVAAVALSANPFAKGSIVADTRLNGLSITVRDNGEIQDYDPNNNDGSGDYYPATVNIDSSGGATTASSSSYISTPGVWKGCAYQMDDGHRFTSRLQDANHSWSNGNFSTSNTNSRYFIKANVTDIARFVPSNVVIDGSGNLRLVSSAVPTSSSQINSLSGELHTAWNGIVSASVHTVSKGTVNPGTVYASFFYGVDPWYNETDIELRSGYSYAAYFTNQNYHNALNQYDTTNVTFKNGKSVSDWHEYRVDYLKGSVSFYIDGMLMLTKTAFAPSGPGQ